jgi:hypothetical protein
MRPLDTSPEAHDFQVAGYRRMLVSRKAELVAELSESVRSVAREGIRQRHPDYDERSIERALLVLLYGREVVHRLWPTERFREP